MKRLSRKEAYQRKKATARLKKYIAINNRTRELSGTIEEFYGIPKAFSLDLEYLLSLGYRKQLRLFIQTINNYDS